MLISLSMSSTREHPPKDCVGSLAQLDIARFVFYNYTWELDQRTMDISYQHECLNGEWIYKIVSRTNVG
jgi:hypothetical protein